MSIINGQFLRPFSKHKGLPQLFGPTNDINGEFYSLGNGMTTIQYQPCDHPDHCTMNLEQYTGKEMLYRINRQNFRCENFDKDNPGILTVGCSHTYGIGLKDREVWGSRVAKSLGIPLWNIGVGGIGPQACLLLTKQFLLAGYKPKMVVVQWPNPNRQFLSKTVYKDTDTEMIDFVNQTSNTFVPDFWSWAPKDHMELVDPAFEKIVKGRLLAHEHNSFEFYSIREAFISLCNEHNLKLVEIEPNVRIEDDEKKIFKNCVHNIPFVPNPWGGRCDESYKARDNLHYGPDVHNQIATEVLEKL